MYLVGSSMVFASWVGLVPTGLGWIGWRMALGGWAIGHQRATGVDAHGAFSRAEQIEKLDALRQRQLLTEEEFERERRRLLGS